MGEALLCPQNLRGREGGREGEGKEEGRERMD